MKAMQCRPKSKLQTFFILR